MCMKRAPRPVLAAVAGGTLGQMSTSWTPELSVREVGGRCFLCLGSQVQGEGATLQEAADDLVRRLLALAMSMRSAAGFRVSPEAPGVDLRWFGFLYELGSIAAGGGDIRDRVFAQAA
jgi:hypothetical protein